MNTTTKNKEGRREGGREGRKEEKFKGKWFSLSSLLPPPCALSLRQCLSFPSVGSWWGQDRKLGAGARTPGLEWGFGFGGGAWLASKMGGSAERSVEASWEWALRVPN